MEERVRTTIPGYEAVANQDAEEKERKQIRRLYVPDAPVKDLLVLRLMTGADVTMFEQDPRGETLTVGVADTLGLLPDGQVDVVVDRKSDVTPVC